MIPFRALLPRQNSFAVTETAALLGLAFQLQSMLGFGTHSTPAARSGAILTRRRARRDQP